MRPKVVIAHAGPGETTNEDEVFAAADVEVIAVGELESESAQAIAREADAVMVGLNVVSAKLLSEMTRCKVVTRIGTGVDAIDWVVLRVRVLVQRGWPEGIALEAVPRQEATGGRLVVAGSQIVEPGGEIGLLTGEPVGIHGATRLSERQTEGYIRTYYKANGFDYPIGGIDRPGGKPRALLKALVHLARAALHYNLLRHLDRRAATKWLVTLSRAEGSVARHLNRKISDA